MRKPAPRKAKITIYEVAERAGVAVSTVSRVINEANNVSDHTRRHVLQAIEELQFRPDRTARTLAQSHGRPIAVAVPTFASPFYTELLKGIRSALREHDVDLLLCDLGWQHTDATLLRFLKRGAVEGLLLVGVKVSGALNRELLALHTPVVLVGHPHPAFDAFYWDDTAAARQAVEHLIAQGHRRIGMIHAHTERDTNSGRMLGYRQALEGAGLPVQPELVVCGSTQKHAGFSEEAGYEAMQRLLALGTAPTAVFASSDMQAIGAWKAVRDAGLRVPDEIALVGYGNMKTSHYIGLTSVDIGVQEVGRRAAEVLLQRVTNRRSRVSLPECVASRVVLRASSPGAPSPPAA